MRNYFGGRRVLREYRGDFLTDTLLLLHIFKLDVKHHVLVGSDVKFFVTGDEREHFVRNAWRDLFPFIEIRKVKPNHRISI